MVLIMVLVVVAMLTLVCLAFAELMFVEHRGADLSSRQTQARAAADSGMEMVRLFLSRDAEYQEQEGGWYQNQQRFGGRLVQYLGDGDVDDAKRFAIIAPGMEDGYYGGVRYGLEDESTKLNINLLAVLDEKYGQDAGRELLMSLPGMTEDIADAILDWIDEDEGPRDYGAESDYYSGCDPPYYPKNGPLETIEELLLVRDVTPELLFGTDHNHNGLADPGEPDAEAIENVDNIEGTMNRGWAAYLTLHSMEVNLTPEGEPKIDLNQDDMEELYEQLVEKIGAPYATFIVGYRQQSRQYSGSRQGEMYTGGELDLKKNGRLKLTTILDLIGQRVQVTFKGEQQPRVLQPMFAEEPIAMTVYLPILMDYTTINPAPVIPGRININQTSRTVLAGIPGIDEELIEQIIVERIPNPIEAEDGRRHETWLLSEGFVDLAQMKALMPFVCARGSVYKVQAVGYFDRGGTSVRIQTILDATTLPPKVVFYRDLSHLGRGYALATLGVGMEGAQGPETIEVPNQ